MITSIAYLTLLSIVILVFAMIVLIALHVWIHFYIPFGSTYWFTCLYIILIVFEHDVCITFHLIVIVCMWTWVIYPILCLTACCMTVLLLHDCMSLVHVGHTSIHLPPTFLVSVILFIPVLTIASVRPCVCLLLWPSQRLGVGSSDELYRCLGAFWRWPTLWCQLESDHWRPV